MYVSRANARNLGRHFCLLAIGLVAVTFRLITLMSIFGAFALCLATVLPLVEHLIYYLQNGYWPPATSFDVLRRLLADGSLLSWLDNPHSWFGLHTLLITLLNFLPAWVGVSANYLFQGIICAVCAGISGRVALSLSELGNWIRGDRKSKF